MPTSHGNWIRAVLHLTRRRRHAPGASVVALLSGGAGGLFLLVVAVMVVHCVCAARDRKRYPQEEVDDSVRSVEMRC